MSVFVVFYKSLSLENKLKKICDAFTAHHYSLPDMYNASTCRRTRSRVIRTQRSSDKSDGWWTRICHRISSSTGPQDTTMVYAVNHNDISSSNSKLPRFKSSKKPITSVPCVLQGSVSSHIVDFHKHSIVSGSVDNSTMVWIRCCIVVMSISSDTWLIIYQQSCPNRIQKLHGLNLDKLLQIPHKHRLEQLLLRVA